MTEICVNTGALGGAAQGIQRLHSAADRRSQDVAAIARGLDMEIKARTHIDRHIARLGRDIGVQADKLQRHSVFLTQAQRTYDDAERRVLHLVDGTGVDPGAKSAVDALRSMLGKLWKLLGSGALIVSPRLLQELFSKFAKLLGSLKDLVSVSKDFVDEYAHFVNSHMKLSELTGLKSFGTGTYVWAMRLQALSKWVGRASIILSVVDAIQAGYQDFKNGVGSFAHRVGSSVVVGVATLGGGILGGLGGKFIGGVIGGAIGSIFPGPGTAIGAALGAAAGAWVGSMVGSKVATWAVSAGGEKSVKHLVGDAVESEVDKVQTGAMNTKRSGLTLGGVAEGVVDAIGRGPLNRGPTFARIDDFFLTPPPERVLSHAFGPATAVVGGGGGGGW